MPSLIFIFLDGFGLGYPVKENPLHTLGLPYLQKIIKSPLIQGHYIKNPELVFSPIDSVLGIPGIPQSATGQTSLLTGQNAQKILGYHLSAFPDQTLVDLIHEYSLLKQMHEKGLKATFANAYTPSYFENQPPKRKNYSVTTHCVLASDKKFRTTKDLLQNKAVYWDITRNYLIQNIATTIPPITPKEAGKHITDLAKNHHLVLFECFKPDLIGHSKNKEQAEQFLQELDQFLENIINSMCKTTTLLISSDHGNIEDISQSSHTSNPVPLIVYGPMASHFHSIERIDQITPAILKAFEEQSHL